MSKIKTTHFRCECKNPRERWGCACNSASAEPCSYCDWNWWHEPEACGFGIEVCDNCNCEDCECEEEEV